MGSFITDDERRQLLANGAVGGDGALSLWPVVKLFTPDAHATWLLVSLDPADQNSAFALCDLGIGIPRLDRVRLSDLQSIRGPRDMRVLRDLHFVPKRSLAEYLQRAEVDGSIND